MERGSDTAVTGGPRSAAAVAYEFIKERLLNGGYSGGTLLSENELARRLGISRTPVRQAMLRLAGEGLVELYPRRGALVLPPRVSEPDDVLEARLLIEPHCGRRAAELRSPGLVASLREAIDAQLASLDDGGTGFVAADREFHRRIVEANRNEILVGYYEGLRDRQQRLLATSVAGDPDSVMQYVAEHRAIADAIDRGDGVAAAELTEQHLRDASRRLRRDRI
jgi:DNA-binding GntR family transcriptional regulator